MRLPRDVGGEELARRLAPYGYVVTRQTGSHMRLTRQGPQGEQHITIPRHRPLRVGTLNGVLREVAYHLGVSKEELVQELFRER